MKDKLAHYPTNFTDEFVKSVEFGEKFDHLNEFELGAVHLNFVQYYCLDVILVALAVLVGSLVLLAKGVQFSFNKLQSINKLKIS